MSSTYVRFKQLKCEAFLLKRNTGHILVFVAIQLEFFSKLPRSENGIFYFIYRYFLKRYTTNILFIYRYFVKYYSTNIPFLISALILIKSMQMVPQTLCCQFYLAFLHVLVLYFHNLLCSFPFLY